MHSAQIRAAQERPNISPDSRSNLQFEHPIVLALKRLNGQALGARELPRAIPVPHSPLIMRLPLTLDNQSVSLSLYVRAKWLYIGAAANWKRLIDTWTLIKFKWGITSARSDTLCLILSILLMIFVYAICCHTRKRLQTCVPSARNWNK